MGDAIELAVGPRRGRWRSRIGWVLLGVMLACLGSLGIDAISSKHRKNVNVEVVGSDVSIHGGVEVRIENEGGHIVQTCNGVCDDLILGAVSGDNIYSVNVVDVQGKCIICGKGSYVTNGLDFNWRVAGREKLAMTERLNIE